MVRPAGFEPALQAFLAWLGGPESVGGECLNQAGPRPHKLNLNFTQIKLLKFCGDNVVILHIYIALLHMGKDAHEKQM